MVLEPPAPVESAPLPYSTKNMPCSVVMESGALAPFGAEAKVFVPLTETILILLGCWLRRGKRHPTDDACVTREDQFNVATHRTFSCGEFLSCSQALNGNGGAR